MGQGACSEVKATEGEAPCIRLFILLTHKNKTPTRGVLFFMEAAGIEPASENPFTKLSPGAEYLLALVLPTPTLRLRSDQLFYA